MANRQKGVRNHPNRHKKRRKTIAEPKVWRKEKIQPKTMKRLIFIMLFFLLNELYAQKDTIVLQEKDIKIRQEQVYDLKNPRGGYQVIKEFSLKESGEKLNGFYKITAENHHYTLYFENGIKSLKSEPYINIVKYYQGDKIYQLDIFYPIFVTNLYYYSVENFDPKAKKLVGYKKSIFDDVSQTSFKIRQKTKKDSIQWILKGDVKGKMKFLKTNLQ